MSTPFARGKVLVTNGSTTVRAVWVCDYASTTGTPQAGEALSWAGGGVGTLVQHVSGSMQVHVVRTSGPNPAAGTVITGGSSGATWTLAGLAAGTPPGFDTAGLASGMRFFVEGRGIPYVLGSTFQADNFALQGSYAEVTETNVGYSITRDYSPFFGWALPRIGDVDAPAVVSEGIVAADGDVSRALYTLQTLSISGGVATADWSKGRSALLTLTENMTLSFTAPKGPTLLVLVVRQDASGSRVITWPSTIRWANGSISTPTSAANAITLYTFFFDGSVYLFGGRNQNLLPA
jgi:hypothetical protein